MATIFKRLSDREDKKTHRREILIRFKQGNKLDQRAKTNIFIDPGYWRPESKEKSFQFDKEGKPILDENGEQKFKLKTIEAKIVIKNRLPTPEHIYHAEAQKRLAELEGVILDAFLAATNKSDFPADWLSNLIDKFNNPEKYEAKDETPQQTFFDVFDNFLELRKLSDVRKKNFRVIYRTLQRYERYKGITLHIDTITDATLRDIDKFLREEHNLCDTPKYQKILKDIPESRTPQPRGQNTINDIFTKLRTFFLWCVETKRTTNLPKITIEECVYGTPFYISIEERKQIERTNLSNHPQVAIQRDIFVFQCLIGCRVADLYKMTRQNIVDGAIQYVPRKTKEGRPITVTVPLNSTANEILKRYADYLGDGLFPFISEQKYNVAIKRIFRAARINRIVQWRNPLTGDSEPRPLCELASSHLARRTFVGNIYKQVKDPNLVGSLSGHKEGSRAFSRYRDIDNDIKAQLTKLLD